jgi:hypothetical protein
VSDCRIGGPFGGSEPWGRDQGSGRSRVVVSRAAIRSCQSCCALAGAVIHWGGRLRLWLRLLKRRVPSVASLDLAQTVHDRHLKPGGLSDVVELASHSLGGGWLVAGAQQGSSEHPPLAEGGVGSWCSSRAASLSTEASPKNRNRVPKVSNRRPEPQCQV